MADMKCIVHDCKNHLSEGAGRTFFLTDHSGALLARFICNPCYYALIEPQNQSTEHSQVYRNMQLTARQKYTEAEYQYLIGQRPEDVIRREMQVHNLVETCDGCPTVFEWQDEHGVKFYFRLRHGHARICNEYTNEAVISTYMHPLDGCCNFDNVIVWALSNGINLVKVS